jgi:hypothetical protein
LAEVDDRHRERRVKAAGFPRLKLLSDFDLATGYGLLREEPFPKMICPLVRELNRDGFPVTVTCRVMKFSTKNYYRCLRSLNYCQ